jgi:hypothetical protein
MTKQLWQFNESPQRLNDIAREVVSLRRENRFLKVGLIFCLVLSAMPYLTGFQPTVIRASKVVTKRIEFVRDGKTVMSFSLHPKRDELVILGRGELPAIGIARGEDGGTIGTYNKGGKLVAVMGALPEGGTVQVNNKDGKLVAGMGASLIGGGVEVRNNNDKTVAVMMADLEGGGVAVSNNNDKTVAAMIAKLEGGGLVACNEAGEAVAMMSVVSGGGFILLKDYKMNDLVSMTATPLGGTIKIKAPSGQTLWSAP